MDGNIVFHDTIFPCDRPGESCSETNCSEVILSVTLALKMAYAQVAETSVTITKSSFQNYTHPDDHKKKIIDTPGFKPFTRIVAGPIRFSELNTVFEFLIPALLQ